MGRCNRVHNEETLGTASWKSLDEGALPEGRVRDAYFARKKALTLYLRGAGESEIRSATGVGLSEVVRLLKTRCLLIHQDGEVWGWRALVPWQRISDYQRKTEIIVDKFGYGAVGALNATLNEHPGLREKFRKRILSAGAIRRISEIKRNKYDHWRWFLDQLRQLGYERDNKWPFNTKRLGYSSICTHIARVLREEPEAAALVTGGSEAKKKLLSGDGVDRPVQRVFERVEMDAHKLDGRFSVLLPQPTGGYVQKIVHRLWVIVILEVISRCVLGYHFSMRKEVSKTDVLRAIKTALTRWKRPPISFGEHAYLSGANLPSGDSEDFVGVCWDQTSVDGALAETCKPVIRVLADAVGSELIQPKNSFSARRSKDDRPFIETFFRTLGTRGFQKISNTTGGKPSDKRGRNPEEIALTSQFQIEYARELLTVLIANYNATPHSSLGSRSPLEYLRFRVRQLDQPLRYADPTTVADIVSFRKQCIVRGGFQQGRRPFINFAHGRYTNDVLAQRHDLVGQKIWVINHIEDDSRIVRASTLGGQSLGLLRVSAPWNKLPHSLEVRTAIASYISQGKLQVAAGHDAVEAFVNYSEQQTDKKLPVHPAYLEARRILVDVAEAVTEQSMLHVANERLPAEVPVSNAHSRHRKGASSHSGSSSLKRRLPAPRKAANK
ncbi:hypothetical protein CCAE64S_02817 [Castellaniella caeni]